MPEPPPYRMDCGFSPADLDDLTRQAKGNPRRRQHRNLHESFRDPCQRLLNAIETNSYIRPHRHTEAASDETLVAVRGAFALVTFDDQGVVTGLLRFASEKFGGGESRPVGVRIHARAWHTVVALADSSILLEVKAGPFDPAAAKIFAEWAPVELSTEGTRFAEAIRQLALNDKAVDR